MNNDDHLLTLKIDAYIKGQLSGVEKQAFEKELETDISLADRLRTQRAELVLLDIIAEEDLRLKVRKWSAQLDNDEGKSFKKWWRHPLSIFAFLGSLIVLFFLFYPKKTTTEAAIQVSPNIEKKDTTQDAKGKEQEAKPKAQTPKPPIATIPQATIRKDLLAYVEDIDRTAERGDEKNDSLRKSVQFIQNQKFTSGRNELLGISPQAVNYADAQFLLATIDYLQNKPKAAAATFKILSNMDGYIRKEQAAYYWAVSLVADGQMTEAKKILAQITADTEHPKQGAAIALLKSL